MTASEHPFLPHLRDIKLRLIDTQEQTAPAANAGALGGSASGNVSVGAGAGNKTAGGCC